MKISDLTS
jgi:hypothetical protein